MSWVSRFKTAALLLVAFNLRYPLDQLKTTMIPSLDPEVHLREPYLKPWGPVSPVGGHIKVPVFWLLPPEVRRTKFCDAFNPHWG